MWFCATTQPSTQLNPVGLSENVRRRFILLNYKWNYTLLLYKAFFWSVTAVKPSGGFMDWLCRWLWVCVSLWVHICARAGMCVYEWGLASPVLLYNPMLHLSLWTRGLLVDCMCQTLDNYTDCFTRTSRFGSGGVKNNFRKIKRNWAPREKPFSTV